jgi:hypothetical protein
VNFLVFRECGRSQGGVEPRVLILAVLYPKPATMTREDLRQMVLTHAALAEDQDPVHERGIPGRVELPYALA